MRRAVDRWTAWLSLHRFGAVRSLERAPSVAGRAGATVVCRHAATEIASIVGGRALDRRARRPPGLDQPCQTAEIVATALLGDASTFVDACRAAREAQQAWARGPRARSAAARSSRPAGWSRTTRRRSRTSSRARSASPTRSRWARCRRSSTPATSSWARAGGCMARRCRRRCPTSSCSPSACRSASPRSSPPATSRSRCPSWYLVPALLCGNAVVWKPADYAPATAEALAQLFLHARAARRRAEPGACDGPTTSEGLERALEEGLVDKVGFTGSSRGRPPDRRALRAPPADARASSSAARTRWS